MGNANSIRSPRDKGLGKGIISVPAPIGIEKLNDRFIDMQDAIIKTKDMQIEMLKKTNSIMLHMVRISIRVSNIEQILAIKNNLKQLQSKKNIKR